MVGHEGHNRPILQIRGKGGRICRLHSEESTNLDSLRRVAVTDQEQMLQLELSLGPSAHNKAWTAMTAEVCFFFLERTSKPVEEKYVVHLN
ncbi:troponin T, fast skeletal muscle [Sarotherodon galilaeus]